MDTDNPFELLIKADEEFKSSNFEKAREICINSIERFPEFPTFYSLLVEIYIKEQNRSEAERIIDIAIKKFPTNSFFKLIQKEFSAKSFTQNQKEEKFESPEMFAKDNVIMISKYAFTTFPFLGRTNKIPFKLDNFIFRKVNTPELETLPYPGLRLSISRLWEIS